MKTNRIITLLISTALLSGCAFEGTTEGSDPGQGVDPRPPGSASAAAPLTRETLANPDVAASHEASASRAACGIGTTPTSPCEPAETLEPRAPTPAAEITHGEAQPELAKCNGTWVQIGSYQCGELKCIIWWCSPSGGGGGAAS